MDYTKLNSLLTISNTSTTSYYYAFNTQYNKTNIYSDILLSTIKRQTEQWQRVNNSNFQLVTDEFEDEYEERVLFSVDKFGFQHTSISNFFSTNLIDIPRCLQKSYLLYKPIFNTPHLKFLNILMRKGYKEQMFSTVFKTFVTHYLTQTRNQCIDLLQILPFLTTTFLDKNYDYQTLKYQKFNFLQSAKSINQQYLTHPQTTRWDIFLNSLVDKYKPLFMFKVQKVDKMTRKHSRGKSGKYVILWKYVPLYRRIYTVLRWLIQDISFQKAYRFETRFLKTITTLLETPKKSTVVKCRNFNHQFVFKNFKKTLLKTLQTVS